MVWAYPLPPVKSVVPPALPGFDAYVLHVVDFCLNCTFAVVRALWLTERELYNAFSGT